MNGSSTLASNVRRARDELVASVLAITLLAMHAVRADAHEGHETIPTTGVAVDGNRLLVSPGAYRSLGVETAKVTLGNLTRDLRVRARIELPSHGQALVTTRVPGRIRDVLVRPGEQVQAGQKLASVESLEFEALQLEYVQAAEELDFAQKIMDQRRSLANSGAVPGKLLLESESDSRQKRVQFEVAKRKLQAIRPADGNVEPLRTGLALDEPLALLSPIAGVVMRVAVRPGQEVQTTEHLFHVVDPARMWVVGEILETDAWRVQPEMKASATFATASGRTYHGAVERFRLRVDPVRRTLDAIAPVENPGGELRPGMLGRMDIQVDAQPEAIVCPAAALLHAAAETYVLVRQGEGRFERRAVRIGLRTKDNVDILDGLFPGDQVVVTGAKLLAAMFHDHEKPQHVTDAATKAASFPSIEAKPIVHGVVGLPAQRKALVASAVPGRISRIHVQPGETVEPGRLLAEVDSQPLRTLQLELLQAREQLAWTRALIDRVAPLHASGSFSRVQFWRHELQRKQLEHQERSLLRSLSMIGLSEAELRTIALSDDLSAAGANLPGVPIRAASHGIVCDFAVAQGQIVRPNDTLFEVQDRRELWIEGHVLEEDASQIGLGMVVEVSFPAYPGLSMQGVVARMSPAMHERSQTLPVWIELDDSKGQLREGMLAQGEIPALRRREAAAVQTDTQ